MAHARARSSGPRRSGCCSRSASAGGAGRGGVDGTVIRPDETSDWEEAVGGLVCVGTRALTSAERVRIERSIAASRRVVLASTVWTALYVVLGALFVTHIRELGTLGTVVCVGLVPTIAAVGYGHSAARQMRWLRGDLASDRVRLFEGESLSTAEDRALAHLAEQPRFATADPSSTLYRVELLASSLPLPADGEQFSPYRARPFRVALPRSIAPPGATRALSTAEREELRAYAARRRRIGLEHGVGIVWGSMALFALGRWAAHGFPRAEVAMFPGVRILVVSFIGVAAIVSLWLRRRDARELDAAATQGEVIGGEDAERLPNGVPWTEHGRPAGWRRG